MFITGYTIKTIFMLLYVSYSNRKILNFKKDNRIKNVILLDIFASILYACMCKLLKTEINTTIFIIVCMTVIYTTVYKIKTMYSLLITAVSLAINQILCYISAIIVYLPIKTLNIENEYPFFI